MTMILFFKLLTALTHRQGPIASRADPTNCISNRTPISFPVRICTVLQHRSPSPPLSGWFAKLQKHEYSFISPLYINLTIFTGIFDRSQSAFETGQTILHLLKNRYWFLREGRRWWIFRICAHMRCFISSFANTHFGYCIENT